MQIPALPGCHIQSNRVEQGQQLNGKSSTGGMLKAGALNCLFPAAKQRLHHSNFGTMIPLSLTHPHLTNCQLIKQHNKAHQGTLLFHGLVMLNGHSITVYTVKCCQCTDFTIQTLLLRYHIGKLSIGLSNSMNCPAHIQAGSSLITFTLSPPAP